VKDQDDKTPRQVDVDKTTFKAVAILVMFVISVISMCYIGWLLWTLPPRK
jgi:hypothetical protein